MALKISSTAPQQGAVDVKSAPAIIEIVFSEQVDRKLAESGITLDPPRETFFKWEVRERTEKNTSSGLPNSSAPILTIVKYDVLRILTQGPFESYKTYTLKLPAAKAKSIKGEQLAADFMLTFKTRAQGVHIAPSNIKGGDSCSAIPKGEYKRAIVLSGGGAKGDFQVGALKYLYQVEKFFPDLVVGTSVGAINGAKLAEASTVAEHQSVVQHLESLWLALRVDEDIYQYTDAFRKLLDENGSPNTSRIEGLGKLLVDKLKYALPVIGSLTLADDIEDEVEKLLVKIDNSRKSSAVYDLLPLTQRFLKPPHLDANKVFNSKVELVLAASNLLNGKLTYFNKGTFAKSESNLVNSILASAVMPVIFPPVAFQNGVYTDGGVQEVAAVEEAIRQGATDIVVIPTYQVGGFPHSPKLNSSRYNTVAGVGLRALTEIVFDEVLTNDVDKVMKLQSTYNWLRGDDIRIRVIDPELEIHGSLTFHPEGIKRGIDYGYERARRVLNGPGTKQPVPHPIEQSRTSFYLVIDPRFADGKFIPDHRVQHEYEGGLGEQLQTGKFQDLRIVVRENNKVIHTYPSDHFPGYGDIHVPGSDPEGGDTLNPFLKGRRKGMFYAFPLHATHDGISSVNASNVSIKPLEVEVIFSTMVDGKYKEVRHKQAITFQPDANGIMKVQVNLPANHPGGGKSRSVILMRKRDRNVRMNTPCLVIHGTGEIANLAQLSGHDGALSNGRWEASRNMSLMPGLFLVDSITPDVEVTGFELPNFQGRSIKVAGGTEVKTYNGLPTGIMVGGGGEKEAAFPIASIKVRAV